jgi:hypothetical protein
VKNNQPLEAVMFEIETAFAANYYEQNINDALRGLDYEALPHPEPATRRVRIFRTSFGAAFALATAAFWFTVGTDPPKTDAATLTSAEDQTIIAPPSRDAHCANYVRTCPEK